MYGTSQRGDGYGNLYWTPKHWTHQFILANKVDAWTDNTLPTISYKYAINTIEHINDIIENNILIIKTFLLPQGDDGEVIHAKVKVCAAKFDKEQDKFLVSLGKGQANDVMVYDATIKILDTQLQRESKLEGEGQLFLFHKITDQQIIKGISSSYEVLVSWEDGSVTW